MNTKMKTATLICAKSVLYTVWTMGANLLVGTALQS